MIEETLEAYQFIVNFTCKSAPARSKDDVYIISRDDIFDELIPEILLFKKETFYVSI